MNHGWWAFSHDRFILSPIALAQDEVVPASEPNWGTGSGKETPVMKSSDALGDAHARVAQHRDSCKQAGSVCCCSGSPSQVSPAPRSRRTSSRAASPTRPGGAIATPLLAGPSGRVQSACGLRKKLRKTEVHYRQGALLFASPRRKPRPSRRKKNHRRTRVGRSIETVFTSGTSRPSLNTSTAQIQEAFTKLGEKFCARR